MIRDLLQDVTAVPAAIRATSHDLLSRLRETPVQIVERQQEARRWVTGRSTAARRWVRSRAHEVRTEGETRLFALEVEALDHGRKLLDRAAGLPPLAAVEAPARRLLDRLSTALLAPDMADYDSLPVRDVLKNLHLVDHIGLLRIRRHEAQTKNRKTVLDAIQREMDKRERQAAL